MTKTNNSPIWVGIDDGHYAIKGVGTYSQQKFLSRACMGRRGGYLGVGEKDYSCTYGTDDGDWTVDESLDEYAPTRFDDYPKSALALVFIHHMLRRLQCGGREVCVVSGLPIGRYYTNSLEASEGIISAKRDNLLRRSVSIASQNEEKVATIGRHIVIAQGLAMFFDQIMDMQGKPTKAKNGKPSLNQSMAIVDIGGRTLDCLIVKGGKLTFRETRNLGGMDLEDQVSSALQEYFDTSEPTPRMRMSAIATGICEVRGKQHDVSNIIKKPKDMFADHIVEVVRAVFGTKIDDAERLVLGGGTATHVWNAFHKEWGDFAELIPQAEYANARGMYKFGRFVRGNTK
ncbi:MAG: ParM/StbA family protein [Actinomycetaceae bacterium]|nr:ParM/StbA family protein [Actinomycetaceae bacterium]